MIPIMLAFCCVTNNYLTNKLTSLEELQDKTISSILLYVTRFRRCNNKITVCATSWCQKKINSSFSAPLNCATRIRTSMPWAWPCATKPKQRQIVEQNTNKTKMEIMNAHWAYHGWKCHLKKACRIQSYILSLGVLSSLQQIIRRTNTSVQWHTNKCSKEGEHWYQSVRQVIWPID